MVADGIRADKARAVRKTNALALKRSPFAAEIDGLHPAGRLSPSFFSNMMNL